MKSNLRKASAIPASLLTGALLMAPVAVLAQNTVTTVPISVQQAQGIQQVDLTLPVMAALSEHPEQFRVLDANDQAMPLRLNYPIQAAKTVAVPLQLYRWPTQFNQLSQATTALAEPALEQLKLELKRGGTEATLTWPDSSQTVNLSQKGQDKIWLFASPEIDQKNQVKQLLLSWNSQAVSSGVQVEGSDDLIDWQLAGVGSVLETQNTQGAALKQQRVDVQQGYRFWKVSFDQPIALSSAALNTLQAARPLLQQQVLDFKPTETKGQWQAVLKQPIRASSFSFNVPENQLWSIELQARQKAANGINQWQTVAAGSLYQQQCMELAQCQIELGYPVSAQQWLINAQGPAMKQDLKVVAQAAKTELLFLAQGEAPYRLQIGAQPGLKSTQHSAELPDTVKANYQALLGEMQIQEVKTSFKQYALWAGLIVLVLLLAFAAWRLLVVMQPKV